MCVCVLLSFCVFKVDSDSVVVCFFILQPPPKKKNSSPCSSILFLSSVRTAGSHPLADPLFITQHNSVNSFSFSFSLLRLLLKCHNDPDLIRICVTDVGPLVRKQGHEAMAEDPGVRDVVRQLDLACRYMGFFYVVCNALPTSFALYFKFWHNSTLSY